LIFPAWGTGSYTLTVTDASGCTPATQSYAIQNTDSTVPTPSVSNVQVCSSGSALISVNDASSTAVYNLYTDAGSTTPAEQSKGGKFKVEVSGNTSFYITQISGACESSRAQVNVSVGLSALSIANTFTPNGDGINDYWKINNIENYPQALVQVFSRDGFKVFESRGYQVPFDGTYKGQKLPSGVYYFIINLNANCSLLSGSLSIIR
jgi:gliding motility-associated-like protein